MQERREHEHEQRNLEIQTPCPKSWDSLVGDDAKRFCSQCSLHVHNSAALTRDEAHRLVRESEERVCMRIVRDAEGSPVYLDSCAPVKSDGADRGPVRALPRAAGWILIAGASLMSACEEPPAPERPVPIDESATMGAVAPEWMGEVEGLEILGDVALPCDDPAPDSEPRGGIESPNSHAPEGCDEEPTRNTEILGRIALPPDER